VVSLLDLQSSGHTGVYVKACRGTSCGSYREIIGTNTTQEIEKYEQEFIPQSPQESWEDLEADVHQETKPTPKVEEKPKSKGRPKKK
jgi:hypothetical protein